MVAAQQEILIVELEPEVNSVCPDNALDIARQDIRTNVSNILQEETGSIYTCGSTTGRHAVYLNMTDSSSSECPSGWQLTSLFRRTCGRVSGGRTILCGMGETALSN